MIIEEKLESAFRLLCRCGHSFTRKRLGLGVECPACGATETSAALHDAYTRAHEARARTEAA